MQSTTISQCFVCIANINQFFMLHSACLNHFLLILLEPINHGKQDIPVLSHYIIRNVIFIHFSK